MITASNNSPSTELVPVATNRVREISAHVGKVAGRSAYSLGYYVSFGISYPAMLLASFVPRDSALARGARDGASGASAASERVQAQAAAMASATREKVGGAYVTVVSSVGKRVEGIQDALAERAHRRSIAST